MKRLLLLMVLLAGTALADPGLNDLGWMSGRWSDGTSEESWSLPEGGTMIGYARTVKDGKTVFFEYLRLEETAQGVDYVASPMGKTVTRFRLTEVGTDFAVFSNPQHDFPKQIRYTLKGDVLVAEVGDGERTESWRYQRLEADHR